MQHGVGFFCSSGITKWEDKACVTSQEISRTNLFAILSPSFLQFQKIFLQDLFTASPTSWDPN